MRELIPRSVSSKGLLTFESLLEGTDLVDLSGSKSSYVESLHERTDRSHPGWTGCMVG